MNSAVLRRHLSSFTILRMRRIEQTSTSLVVDSEPEREEARKIERVNRRRARRQPRHKSTEAKGKLVLAEVPSSSRLPPGQTRINEIPQDPGSPPPFNLSKYAHNPQTAPIRRSTSISDQTTWGVKRAETEIENLPLPLSAVEVSHLTTCVACGVAWTVQKTPVQKLYHIQRCGRVKGLTIATIRQLVLNPVKVERVSQVFKAKVKHLPTKSLMEQVLGDQKPAKRRKKAATTPSVLDIGSAQVILREKAQTIFAPNEDTEDYSGVPPATQAFASSKLAQRLTISRRLEVQSMTIPGEKLDSPVNHGDTNMHLPQDTTMHKILSDQMHSSDPEGVQEHSIYSSSVGATSDHEPGLNLSQGSCYLHYSQVQSSASSTRDRPPSLLSVTSSPDSQAERTNIEFRRLLSTSSKSTKRAPPPVKLPRVKTRASLGRPRKTKVTERAAVDGRDEVYPPRRRRATKKPKDISWYDDLRAALVGDPELYPRILRYEPLSLDLIAQHVDLPDLSERALFNELKKFLDHECINFYDADLQKGRNRRKHT